MESSQSNENENENIEDERRQDEEAQKVRKIYRNIREQFSENRIEYIDPNSDAIEIALENIETTFKRVKKPREAVSDSNILLELAILAKERIKNVHCEFRSFNNSEFMDKLKVFMLNTQRTNVNRRIDTIDEEDEDMDEITDEEDNIANSRRKSQKIATKDYVLTKPIISSFGKTVMNYFRIPPRPVFLIGSLDKEVQVKQKIQRQRKAEKVDLEAQRTKIKQLDANSKENETNDTVNETERIYEVLKKVHKKMKGAPICLYEFMINTKSFSRTIENIFYISFLVKDGYVKIYLDEEELPVIEPNYEDIPESFASAANFKKKDNQVNIQSMISLSKIEWKEIIEVFEIENGHIPDLKHH